MESSDNFDEIAMTLLMSDVELGLTFLKVSDSYSDEERRRTAVERATTTYEKVREFIPFVRMSSAQLADLRERLAELNEGLKAEGCS